jgi:phospholipid/cholesterol/gamma-HCH transport system ATP-binding protein
MAVSDIEQTEHAADPQADIPENILSVRDITVGFGSKIILQDLDLDVHRGKCSALLVGLAPVSRC